MRKAVFIIFFLMGLSGCKRVGDNPNSQALSFADDSLLLPYKKAFYDIVLQGTGRDLSTENIPIRFAALGYTPERGGVNGLCRIALNSRGEAISRYIEIDATFFTLAQEGEKRMIVFHELGHCSLKRPHTEALEHSIPVSIMYPMTLENSLFLGRQQAYLAELINNSFLLNPAAATIFASHVTGDNKLMSGFMEEGITIVEFYSQIRLSGHHICDVKKSH